MIAHLRMLYLCRKQRERAEDAAAEWRIVFSSLVSVVVFVAWSQGRFQGSKLRLVLSAPRMLVLESSVIRVLLHHHSYLRR